MAARWLRQARFTVRLAGCLLAMGSLTVAQEAPSAGAVGSAPHVRKVDPRLNTPFQNPSVQHYINQFESEGREIYARREEIVLAIGLKPGMAVADIGAGTGAFTRLFAPVVGPKGKVYAIDVSQKFLDHIAAGARTRKQTWVQSVLSSQETTNLPPGSVDMAFICDVYHHLEYPESILASIHRALKPGGTLVLVDFDRVEGKSRPFVLEHIRASQAEFRREVETAGFGPVPLEFEIQMQETFVARFRKIEKRDEEGKKKESTGAGAAASADRSHRDG